MPSFEDPSGAVPSGAPAGRPWRIYLLCDSCVDFTWGYDDEEAMAGDDADLVGAEIENGKRTGGSYNFVVARELEYFLRKYPDRAPELLEGIRAGRITLNPFYTMAATAAMGLEELVRQFYPARAVALRHGLDLSCANHQETPAITWVMATVLAGCGITRLVKSILPYESPWTARLAEPPLFAWEGPDGSRVAVRRHNTDYVQGAFVLKGAEEIRTTVSRSLLPFYEGLGEKYPVDAIGLVGCYGDLAPGHCDLPAVKSAAIAAYNARRGLLPELVDASHSAFWSHVERDLAGSGKALPVFRGDYGTAWDAWPSCLAADAAAWRRAQQRAGLADKLAAVVSLLDPGALPAVRLGLDRGWLDLTRLSDHAWNGSGDGNRRLNRGLRRRWRDGANSAFDSVVADGMDVLARAVEGGPSRRWLVFNGLGWERDAVVRLPGHPGLSFVVDTDTGDVLPVQAVSENGLTVSCFTARGVPASGYRTYAEGVPGQGGLPAGAWHHDGNRLSGPFYSIEVSPVTGGLVSLFDRTRGRELADRNARCHLGQAVYLADGTGYSPECARVELVSAGPVLARIRATGRCHGMDFETDYTLYAALDRLDVEHRLHRPVSEERHELDFVFPFDVPGRHVRYDAPGAVIDPARDLLPGAGRAVTAVRHFVDLFNGEFGITLSQADSFLVEFGRRTTSEDPERFDEGSSTVLAVAMQNVIDANECMRDQGGETDFRFRYSARGHGGGFDPVSAVQFGCEDNNDMSCAVVEAGNPGHLPAGSASLLDVTPAGVIPFTVKPGEEGGIIVRLWDCAGAGGPATVSLRHLGVPASASETDLLERETGPLDLAGGSAVVGVRPRGLACVRFRFQPSTAPAIPEATAAESRAAGGRTGRTRGAAGLLALLVAWLAALPAPGSCEDAPATPRRVKFIATGWDNPTPAQLRRDLAVMEKRPFDGVVVDVTAAGQPEGVGSTPFRAAFGRGAWKEEWFGGSVADLKALKPGRLRHLFLNLLANPGDVDWFDDAGWRDVVGHWRIAARVARAGGMRGILFDPEPYTKPWRQFSYTAQPGRERHPFAEYRAKARERGRAVMAAVAGEFPDAVILTYFLMSYVIQGAKYLDQPDPAAGLAAQGYGLLPAFLDGWLDAAPPGITIVDGDERAYTYNDEADYLRSAVEIKGRAQALVSPSNRAKYRAQVQAGFAFYLDAYRNPPSSPHYVGPKDGTRLDRFVANLASAAASTDEYVWIYGEQGRWWPLPGVTAAWNKEDSYPGWKDDSAEWPARFPGCDTALAFARDPAGAARDGLERLRVAGTLKDLARNGGFGRAKEVGGGKGTDWKEAGAPPGWSSWQDDGSKGELGWDMVEGAAAPGSARARGVVHGCFIQTCPVAPGERYAIEAWCRNRGAGTPWITARWKDGAGKWTQAARDVPAYHDGAGRGEWKRWSVPVTVPPDARELVLLLGVTGQFAAGDATWFDDAAVYHLP